MPGLWRRDHVLASAELAYGLAGIGEADSRESARARLDSMVEGEPAEVAQALAASIGLDERAASQDAIFWAVRRLFERAAADRPLLALVEDLHWAEPTLLDLLEYVARSATRPILIVATARGELLAARPEWGSHNRRASAPRAARGGCCGEPAGSAGGRPSTSTEEHSRRAHPRGGRGECPLHRGDGRDPARSRGPRTGRRWVALGSRCGCSGGSGHDPGTPCRPARPATPDERSVLERGSVVGRTFRRPMR